MNEKEIKSYCLLECKASTKKIKNGKCIWLKTAKKDIVLYPTFIIRKGELYCARPKREFIISERS